MPTLPSLAHFPVPFFPPVASAWREPDGLLAWGGDLSVPRLLAGYQRGIFPWFSAEDPILWWSPSARMVLDPAALNVRRSLAKVLRNKAYTVSINRDFAAVLAACAAPRQASGGTWIVPEMQAAYLALHHAGHAHSVETWVDGVLVGGLYGVCVGQMFFGESMFSHQADGSKIALAHLAAPFVRHGMPWIDCQMHTPHLARLGAALVPRDRFIQTPTPLVAAPTPPQLWTYHWDNTPARPFVWAISPLV